MVCIQCGGKTQVSNSRPQRRSNQVWRRRECLDCKTVFTTEESIQYGGIWRVLGQNGRLQAFSRDKLLLSIYRSCEHRKDALADASGLTNTIISKLSTGVSNGVVQTSVIVQVAQVALNRFDQAASVHYRAHHS